MANETELGNFNHPTDVLSDAISAALVQNIVVMPLIYMENLAGLVNVKEFQKDGSLVAEELAESAPYTFGAGSELTQTSVTSTATKFACVSKVTVEAQQSL